MAAPKHFRVVDSKMMRIVVTFDFGTVCANGFISIHIQLIRSQCMFVCVVPDCRQFNHHPQQRQLLFHVYKCVCVSNAQFTAKSNRFSSVARKILNLSKDLSSSITCGLCILYKCEGFSNARYDDERRWRKKNQQIMRCECSHCEHMQRT